jgi:hypothetical protein
MLFVGMCARGEGGRISHVRLAETVRGAEL